MNDQIKVGELVYKISGEMGNLTTELKKAEAEINKLKGAMERSTAATDKQQKGWKAAATAVKAFVAAFVVERLIAFGQRAVQLAQERLVAETALAQQLRVSRNATDEQIASLIEQAEALEKVGVVDAAVTTAMQARLAGFDLSTDAIKRLTPAILDYTVAEQGANVTMDGAVARANSLAQALQGNFASLTKVGFVLDDATKKQIAHGNEMERVEAIVEVLNSTYEGMNETMGKTFAGTVFRAKDALEDLQTAMGFALMAGLRPLLNELISGTDKMGDTAAITTKLGRVFYITAQALLVAGKAIANGFRTITLGVQGLVLGIAEKIQTVLKIASKAADVLGVDSEKLANAVSFTNDFVADLKDRMGENLNEMGENADEMAAHFSEALDPKGYQEATKADIAALKAMSDQTDQFADSSAEAAKETEQFQEKLTGILDTFKKTTEALQGDLKKAFTEFNKDVGDSLEDVNDKLAGSVLDAQDRIKELKKELSEVDSEDKNAGEQRSRLRAEIKEQEEILKSRKGFEERQAEFITGIREKLTAAGIDAEQEGLTSLLNIKSLEDQIKDERYLRDLDDFAREEELQKRRITLLTDTLIAEVTALREKITQQQALEAELTAFLVNQNAIRKADVDAFANAAIAKYGEMAAALRNAISLQARLNAMRSAPTGGRQFAQGGYTGTTGGTVHPGEYVIPANMVNAMSGLVSQLEGIRTGRGNTINAPVNVTATLNDRLDANSVAKEIAWELGRM